MSVWYCDKHDTFTDLDWHSEGCSKCEQEDIELEDRIDAACLRHLNILCGGKGASDER